MWILSSKSKVKSRKATTELRARSTTTMLHQFPSLPDPIDVPIPADTARNPTNCRYEMLMRAIKSAAGDWVACIAPADIAGRDLKQKSVALHNAAKLRGMKIQTSVQFNFLYVRLAGPGVKVAA
jgi:hypothetical protein